MYYLLCFNIVSLEFGYTGGAHIRFIGAQTSGLRSCIRAPFLMKVQPYSVSNMVM